MNHQALFEAPAACSACSCSRCAGHAEREGEQALELDVAQAGAAQTVGGFPQYQNTIAALSPDERAKINLIARRIVGSFQPGRRPIRTVRLVGHADRDLRRGPAFERRISGERALAMQNGLIAAIKNPRIAGQITWQRIAAGATQLVVTNPRSEAERRRNRRVEIRLRRTARYIQADQGLGETPSRLAPVPTSPARRTCDNRGIPERAAVQALTKRRVACTQNNAFGVTDPFGVISRAVARAREMLDNTIGELVDARSRVCQGETPARLLGNITADWLRNRLGVCIDDIRVWTAGTFVNGSVAEVIRRLVRVRNLIGSNGLRYSCSSPGCEPGFWAFVIARDQHTGKCLPGTPQMLVRLCEGFWVSAKGVSPKIHAEFQAQTIIHEASHLTHCNAPEVRGHTIGVAECLAQFVAATNGSPLDPAFNTSCTTTNRCAGASAAAQREIPELGFAHPGSIRIKGTIFRPQNAIPLKGRPAARR